MGKNYNLTSNGCRNQILKRLIDGERISYQMLSDEFLVRAYRTAGMMTINPIFGKALMLEHPPITFTSQMGKTGRIRCCFS